MSIDNQTTPFASPILEFKSGSFSVPALILSSNDIDQIDIQLAEKVRLAPEFFKNSPVIIDLKELNKQNLEIDVAAIAEVVQTHGLLPIGIRGGNSQQNKDALQLRLPVYANNNRSSSTDQKSIQPISAVSGKNAVQTAMMVTNPIRSGQRLYAQGDLVVLAQVSAGAEILAEGNIHIYGPLRGRALAGVQGNTEAHIFCSNLQAELISIAGNYKISEDLSKNIYTKPVHIYLKDYTLVIKEL